MPDSKEIDPKKQTNTRQIRKIKKKPTASIIQMPEGPPRVHYDLDTVDRFIRAVFHVEPTLHEHVMYAAPTQPGVGLPISKAKLNTTLTRDNKPPKHPDERARAPRACYFGTATCKTEITEDGGEELRNKSELFTSLRVVVLDDIGSKVDPTLIPEAFKPSYIIESSKDNFQYGYILKAPITEISHAKALIQIV